MNPDGEMIPIVEDDQGEGWSDPFTDEEYNDKLEEIQRKIEKYRRIKENKTIR
jgi:hypothetical protein